MTVVPFYEDRVMFGANIPVKINACLQEAVAAYEDTERAENLLWRAQRLDPNQLEVYVALYKFYFYKNRMREAEQAVMKALKQSAVMWGFEKDWSRLTPSSSNWLGLPYSCIKNAI